MKKELYLSTIDSVLQWAETEFNTKGTRSPSGKPIHKNFAFAMKCYIDMVSVR